MILSYQGKSDASAWVGMFLIPSGLFGIISGILAVFTLGKWSVSVFALSLLIHIAIGLGYFPK